MSRPSGAYARDARLAYQEKHPGDIYDAMQFLKDFIGKGNGKADERARDALHYISMAWNITETDDDGNEPEHCAVCDAPVYPPETDLDEDGVCILCQEFETCDDRCVKHHPNCDGYCDHTDHQNACIANPPPFPMK